MGFQHCVQGAGLAVVEGTSASQILCSDSDSTSQRVCKGINSEKGDKESKIPKISGQSVLCSEEKYGQKEGNFRSFPFKPIHSVRQVSDANCFTGTNPTTPWGRNMLHRSYRCVLAYSNRSESVLLPWLQVGKEGVLLQSYAIRAQHCAENFHKVRSQSGTTTSVSGGLSGGVSGRLADLGKLQSRMYKGNPKGSRFPTVIGVSDQCGKITPSTRVEIPMARASVGSRLTSIMPTSQQKAGDCQISQEVCPIPCRISSGTRTGLRSATVRVCNRSYPESSLEGHQSNLAISGEQTFERPQIASTPFAQKTTPALDEGVLPVQIGKSPTSTPLNCHSYRCLSGRLGGSFRKESSSGDVVKQIPELSHQCSGGNGGVVGSQASASKPGKPCSVDPRQHGSDACTEQGGFKVTEGQPCHVGNIQLSKKEKVALVSMPYRGSQECDSRLPISDGTAGDRMVPRPELLQLGHATGSESPNRSVCHISKQSADQICITNTRPAGNRDGRALSRMESMGVNLPLPSIQSPHESPQQTKIFQGSDSLSGTVLAEEQLVSSSNGAGTQTEEIPSALSESSCANADCVRYILDHKGIDFMGFLTFAAQRRYKIEPINIIFSESYKRLGTNRQYDSHFRKFTQFIWKHKPKVMDVNLSLTFFRTLLESGLAANTVNCVRSSLVKIFAYAFDINLNGVHFINLSRACAALNPPDRPEMISWSINKVLRLASDTAREPGNYQTLLRRTLFLIALASGARISELEALSREKGSVRFLKTGEVLLTPHKAFLAKNEQPQDRWHPWKIVPLPQDESLCPVKALRDYISHTNYWKDGRLFQREGGGILTTKGVRQQILYFIKEAEPDSIPKGHDVRKVATSLNFFNFMNFQLLKHYIHWKSPGVFVKHYFKEIDRLRFSVVAAGKVVEANNIESLDDEEDVTY